MIGLDYTAGPGHAPGVGRYVRELVRALLRCDGAALKLVEFGRAPAPMEGAPLGLSGHDVVRQYQRTRYRIPRRVLSAQARAKDPIGALASRGCSLFHRVDPRLPHAPRGPSALAITEFPRSSSPQDRELERAARAAAGVIVFSAEAARRARERYGLDAAAVHQVPVGSDHWERDLEGRVGPRETRDVLVLGAVRRSRHPLEVLRAFEALLALGESARLLIVGRRGDAAASFESALARSVARDSVRWIEEPDERRMPRCVAGSSVLLHFADDEVSPVTPLEALRFGLPVVASALPAFEEVLGGGLHATQSDDPRHAAGALREALERSANPDERAACREIAQRFTWRACAEAHQRAWDRMLGGA